MYVPTTNTNTIPTEPRDHCAEAGACANCDGFQGVCTCECHRPRDTNDHPTPRTLPQILAARIRKLERERRETAEQLQRETEGRRADQLTAFEVHYAQIFPDALREALGTTIGYDTTHDNDDPDEPERGPYAAFQHNGDTWIIRTGSYYGDRYWALDGPAGYFAKIGHDWEYADSPAGPLLDALNSYPDWLATKDQRERAAADAAAAKQATAKQRREDCPLYAYVSGDLRGNDAHLGMLHTGSKLSITVETPEPGDYGSKHQTHHAEIVDWDAQWLLINLDDDETQQRLIPIARVVSVQVRA